MHYVAFQPKWKGRYTLYFGNAAARRPRYDIMHYIGRLRAEGLAQAELGQARMNPAFKRKVKLIPWSEQYKWVIWIALLAVAAVLGLLVYRQIKEAPQPAGQSPPDEGRG